MKILRLSLILLMLAAAQVQGQSNRKVKARFTWDIGNTASTDRLILRAQIPATIDNVQKVNSVKYSVEPQKLCSTDNESYVIFDFEKGSIPSRIVIEADMTLYKHGLSNQKIRKRSEPVPDLTGYLSDEDSVEASDAAIKQLADSLKGNAPEATIRKICTYLADNIAYQSRENGSGLATLKSRAGNCVGKSNLMVALCRASGIPARITSGYMLNQNSLPGWDGEIGHVWVEAWIPQFGWVAFEPVREQPESVPLPWQSMPSEYIYLCRDYLSSEIGGTFNCTWSGGRPRIDGLFRIE